MWTVRLNFSNIFWLISSISWQGTLIFSRVYGFFYFTIQFLWATARLLVTCLVTILALSIQWMNVTSRNEDVGSVWDILLFCVWFELRGFGAGVNPSGGSPLLKQSCIENPVKHQQQIFSSNTATDQQNKQKFCS